MTLHRRTTHLGAARHGRLGRFAAASLTLMLGWAFAVSSPAPAFAQSAAADPTAAGRVRVVHGLRGVVADIYLDDALVLQTFEPERSTDWLALPIGPHRVDVRLAGTPATTPPMLSGTLDVTAGQSWSVVLGLSADGHPAISEFVDDSSPVPAGQTRVVVRHAAAAPPIDVFLNASPIAAGLTNPNEIASQVAAGTYQVSVTQTGSPDVLAPVQDVPFAEGTSNDMYLIGDQKLDTLEWIAVQTAGLETAPTKVQTGDSGLADLPTRSGDSAPILLAAVAAMCCLSGSFMVFTSRRRLRLART
jgi:hypothetical protein